MKALLLAGGYGTRLRPLTETRPKHLLPIANRPHIYRVLDLLIGHGIDEVVLATSYLADAFQVVIHDARDLGMKVEVIHEVEPLGTGGAIKNAAKAVGDGPFLVFNADILTNADLGDLIAFHDAHQGHATIMLVPVDDPSRYGVVVRDESGRVSAFVEKPSADSDMGRHINAGVYVMDADALAAIPDGVVSAEHELFPELVRQQSLFAMPTDGYWIDIGTRESYLAANMDALEQGGMELMVAGDARVDPAARLSSVCVGAGAVVEASALVEASVLLPGAHVGHGATVRDSILGEDSRVGAGAEVVGEIVADRELIGR